MKVEISWMQGTDQVAQRLTMPTLPETFTGFPSRKVSVRPGSAARAAEGVGEPAVSYCGNFEELHRAPGEAGRVAITS